MSKTKGLIKLAIYFVAFVFVILSLYYGAIVEVNLSIIYFILGMILFSVGKHLDNLYLMLSSLLISFGVLLLFISFSSMAVDENREEIASSIQPSLDFVVVSSIESVLESQFPISDDANVKFLLGTNKDIERVYISNITGEQASLIADAFDLSSLDSRSKEEFAKFMIYSIYTELESAGQSEAQIPISSFLETYGEALPIDLSILQTIDMTLLSTFYSAEGDEFLNLLTFEETITKTVYASEVNDEDSVLIWQNLEFDDSISDSSKTKYVQIFVNAIHSQGSEFGIDPNIPIPLATISQAIPPEIKAFSSYDLFSNDLSKRVGAISNMRSDCSDGKVQIPQMCDAIVLTDYDLLMENISSDINENNNVIDSSINLTPFVESINSIQKVEEGLEEVGSFWKSIIWVVILFLLGSIVVAFFSFRKTEEEHFGRKALYYFGKSNLKTFITYYIPLLIVYLILAFVDFEKVLTDAFSNIDLGGVIDSNVFVNILLNLPILDAIHGLFSTLFKINNYYLIISVIIFCVGCYFSREKKETSIEN